MSSVQSDGVDEFTHSLAITLSRALNLVTPNDLLARRVIDIAKTSTVEGFTSGASPRFTLAHTTNTLSYPFPVLKNSYAVEYIRTYTHAAAKSFGKFKDSFLAELHAEILSHAKQEETGHIPEPVPGVQGIIIHDSEVLEPDPVREGGLVRTDAVSQHQFQPVGTRTLIVCTETYVQTTCETDRAADAPWVRAWARQARSGEEGSGSG